MKIFNSFCSAFSMYSRIPVPRVEWKEENRRYALCFFPLIGVFIGGMLLLWQWICVKLHAGGLLYGAVAAWIPIWLTGGIHMDGYMDVCDARSCLGNREKMFAVMKDSHVGAFAVMHMVFYVLLQAALFMEVQETEAMMVTALCFVQSRAYSALAAVTFQNARGEGALMNFSRPAHRRTTVCVELVMILSCWGLMILTHLTMGLCAIVGGLAAFLYYRGMSYRHFGGITGDLAGYFLQVCELTTLACVAAGGYCS